MLDVIENYESQVSEMQQELDHLRRKMELSHNSSHVGSYGGIESGPTAGSEGMSQFADSSGVAVPTDPLKGAGGKWIKDGKAVALRKNNQIMEDQTLEWVGQSFIYVGIIFFLMVIVMNVAHTIH